jgi:hypothetical protein
MEATLAGQTLRKGLIFSCCSRSGQGARSKYIYRILSMKGYPYRAFYRKKYGLFVAQPRAPSPRKTFFLGITFAIGVLGFGFFEFNPLCFSLCRKGMLFVGLCQQRVRMHKSEGAINTNLRPILLYRG